jgi:signal transduction histidine kinase
MRVALAIGAAILVTIIVAFGLADALDVPARDAALRLLPARSATHAIVVAIDEPSLRTIGPWPWPRARLAELVSRCEGARAVIIDVLLTDARAGDDELAAAMRRVPVIAVAVLDDRGTWLLPAPLLREVATAAHGNFEVDHDGILRRLAATKQNGERALPAVSIEAASRVTGAPVPIGVAIAPGFRTPAHTIPRLSAIELLRDPARSAQLRGKLVFIGPIALALGDRVLTPTSANQRPDAGVTVHAAATESLIGGDVIRRLPPLASGLLAGIAVFVMLGASSSRLRRLLLAATFAVIVIIGGGLLLGYAALAIPFATLLLTIGIAAAAIETSVVAATLRQGHAAASRMESRLGIATAPHPAEVGPRIEGIEVKLAEHREREAEAKRLLAHELRTPLASMRGLTQLLGGFELTESERQRVASLLEQEAGKLQSMVTALLDLERLALRDFQASTNVIDLGELVAARVGFLRASTDRPLELAVARGLEVRADAPLIERIVDNLVGNALKYTPAGSAVSIRVRNDARDALLEVEDRGPGIPAAERERMLERFTRGATAAGTEGLGLGLALVGEIARWHGGGVTIDEGEGGGALFRVRFPRAGGS